MSISILNKYERAFAEYAGVKHAFGFWKGRVALSAILDALGVGAGDEIILPGFTCVVVPNAIIYAGAKPVYVDIDVKDYNIDPAKIESKISSRTKAIIIQHTFGITARISEVLPIAKKHNLKTIEDSSQSLGSEFRDGKTGSFADAAFFSTQWSKPYSTGVGGLATTDDEYLAAKLKSFQNQCLKPSIRDNLKLPFELRIHDLFFKPRNYWLALNGYRLFSKWNIFTGSSNTQELASQMPSDYLKTIGKTQARRGLKKIKEIDQVIAHRRKIAGIYHEELPNFQTATLGNDIKPVFLRFPVLVKDKRNSLQLAEKEKIELGDWFLSPVHPNLSGWQSTGYTPRECPLAEEAAAHIVNLPTHQGIDEKAAKRIIDFIKKQTEPYRI